MKKNKKLSLQDLNISSFITTLTSNKRQTLRGGSDDSQARYHVRTALLQVCTNSTLDLNPTDRR